ncbi:MAG: hypothetical protein ACXWRP_12335 [Bdellovibrio sp.]
MKIKTYCFTLILILSAHFIASAQSSPCTQTLSIGADVVAAITNAADGSTICLNSGDYGNLILYGVTKSSAVTLRSTSGVNATIGFTLGSSNNLTFQNLTISVLNWSDNKNSNIKVLNNTFIGQMAVWGNGSGSAQNNVVDRNTFDGIDVGTLSNEGRLQIYDGGDLIVSNNHFGRATPTSSGGDSDGIQIGGYGSVLGPGNVFDGIHIGPSGRHVDAMQLYGQARYITVKGNYFINGGSYILNFSETVEQNTNSIIMDNVFVVGDYYPAVQNAANNLVFKHNTMIGVGVSINSNSVGATAQNNLFTEGATMNLLCSGCTISNNMFDQSDSVVGVNNIVGTPTFVGGASPTTWAGYMLMSNSLGYKAATDGLNMGSNFFNASTPILLAAPLNLRVN